MSKTLAHQGQSVTNRDRWKGGGGRFTSGRCIGRDRATGLFMV